MWNFALDGNGNPKLPGSSSCTAGCRGVVTINNDGSYSFNQEYYSMAQASKAIIPKDWGGPFGQRIAVTVGGSNSWALRVGAYTTGRESASEWVRYSLVVLNCTCLSDDRRSSRFYQTSDLGDDSASSAWNPVPVTASIEFRGVQVGRFDFTGPTSYSDNIFPGYVHIPGWRYHPLVVCGTFGLKA